MSRNAPISNHGGAGDAGHGPGVGGAGAQNHAGAGAHPGVDDGAAGHVDQPEHCDLPADRQVSELQQDGRLSLTDLAERVNLSLSPCNRRLRALEQSGAISGYRAQLDAEALGLTFDALVFVTMRDAAGDPDYVLQVIARDLRAFQKLYDDRISTLPGVQRLSSTLVMKSVVENRPLPL
jgi:DNA-binding Lrp family transcriptional regulator